MAPLQQQRERDANIAWVRDRPGDSRGQKRSLSDSGEASSLSQDSGQDEPEDAIKLWGYMPGHVHYDMNHLDFEVGFMMVAREHHSCLPGFTAKRIVVRVGEVG
jgi:hypothetical protein